MESQAKLKAHPLSGLKQFVTTESPLISDEKCCFFHALQKVFSRYLSFYLDFLDLIKEKVSFKFYDVLAWLTNTYCLLSREVKAIIRQ